MLALGRSGGLLLSNLGEGLNRQHELLLVNIGNAKYSLDTQANARG